MTEEMTDTDVLMAIAVMAVRDDDMCAHDVLETLDALGRRELIERARLVVETDEDIENDPEPDDELDDG